MTVFPTGASAMFPFEKFSDVTMYQFGHMYCVPGYTFGPFEWNHYLFHYIIAGKGVLFSTDSTGRTHKYPLKAGQGFMIWPGQSNTYQADADEPWEYAWVEFDGLLAQELVAQAGLDYNNPIYDTSKIDNQEKMAISIMDIAANEHLSPLVLMGRMYAFLDLLVTSSARRNVANAESPRRYHIRKAITYITHNYCNDITVQDIANNCNVNRSYLSRIFKQTLNSSPTQFLIDYRIKKACELLANSDHSIGEIGALVGYPNQLNFSRAFKRELGVSPNRWKFSRS
ncbi:MAG: AraC family transcriptional regulator [Defluviitaleaceae bacterium]|nr:AraC family transcriptional regulator [Defluviitaleaceae bacterium]